jgi:hypothetical protein
MNLMRKTNLGIFRGHFFSPLAVAVLAIGCSAPDIPYKNFDLQTKNDVLPALDFPSGCTPITTLRSPTLDTFPNPTTYASQAFRGNALGASMVLARVGAYATQPVKVEPGTGRFCLEVTLLPDSSNSVTFTPLDNNGCPGHDTIITITHKTALHHDSGITTPVNVALKQPITSLDPPDSGGILQNLNDGDENTFVVFSFYDWYMTETCDKFSWIRIDLGKVYTVSKLKVRWAPSAGDEYAQCYTVMLSGQDTVGDPDPSPGNGWVIPSNGAVTNGVAGDQTIVITPQSARWAALLLYEDGASGLREVFQVAEVEVWGQDPNAVPPPPPDRCE